VPNTKDTSRLAGAQALESEHHHLLREVRRGVTVAQVPEAVKAHPWRQTAVELGLGHDVASIRRRRDAACKGLVVQRLVF